MLNTMRSQFGIPIQDKYKFTYGFDLVRDFAERRVQTLPDLVVLGIGPAFDLMNACPNEYQPYMIAPAAVHRIISHRNVSGEDPGTGSFQAMTEEATSLACSFDSLCAEGIIQSSKCEVTHFDIGELSLKLRQSSEGFHSLVWAPYSYFLAQSSGGIERRANSGAEFQETVIIAHRRFLENARKKLAFEVLLRQIWWSYLQRPEKVVQAAKCLARDEKYIGTISACLGIGNSGAELFSAH